MGKAPAIGSRQRFVFGIICALVVAPFISRVTLSVALLLFLALTLLHRDIISQLRNFFKTPWLAGMSLLFLLPFVSGLWSSDKKEWLDLVRVKLPLLLLPIAFAGRWQLTSKQWRFVALLFIGVMIAGTAWSFEKYWLDKNAVAESYLRAKVFLTPLQNDHVRFSWLVAIAALACVYFIEREARWLRILLLVVLIWFVLYLHLLAARTGLFSFYLLLLFYVVWNFFHQKNKTLLVSIAMLLVAVPVIAWFALPTFQNRIKYFTYDYSFIRSGGYLPGGNDGARVLSYRAGWHLLQSHPFGTGAGDVYNETLDWYSRHVPNMAPTDKLYPSSEWLLYGGSTGWVGVVVFTIVMVLPFFYPPPRNRFYWYGLCATAALSFLFDIGLEVQYGVFLYAFLLLCWWKWFSQNSLE